MKISELVKRLNRYKREYGDIEVLVSMFCMDEETGNFDGYEPGPLEGLVCNGETVLLVSEEEMDVHRLCDLVAEQYDGNEIIGYRG